MPGGFTIGAEVCAGTDYGANTAASNTTALTAGGVNTKGSWTQLGSAASFDISLLHVTIVCSSTSKTGLIDIGIGPSGSQVVLISNINCKSSPNAFAQSDFLLPVDILSGTAIWARIQSATASDATHMIKLNGFSGAFTNPAGFAGGDGIGVSTASSTGTTLTANATINTKGAYSQLIASTARDYGAIVPLLSPISNTSFLVDFAIGGSGSEQVIVPNMSASNVSVPGVTLPIAIPAGTRIAARCQAGVTIDTIAAALIGLYR